MTATRPVVMQRTDSMLPDEINLRFVKEDSDVVQTIEAELQVLDAAKIDEDTALDLKQRIAALDHLVGKTQLLLTPAVLTCVWGDDRDTITRPADPLLNPRRA